MKTHQIRDWLLANAVGLGFVWGFSEGTLLFIVPDMLITLVALFSLRRSFWCMMAVLAGGLAGGALLYMLTLLDPARMQAIINGVPFVTGSMSDRVIADFQQYGIWAMVHGPLSGIPYKLYAVHAPAYAGFGWFLLVSIPARLERLMISWLVFAGAGVALRKKADSWTGWMLGGHLLYWLAIYIYYWGFVING